jgi:hypothetical protein
MRNGKKRATKTRSRAKTARPRTRRPLPAIGAVPVRTFEDLEKLSIDHQEPDLEALANWLLWYRLGRKRVR